MALSLSRDRIAEKGGAEMSLGVGEKHAPSAAPAPAPAVDAGGHSGEAGSLCWHRRLVEAACRQLFLPEAAFRGASQRCFCAICRPPVAPLDLNADLPKDPSTLPPGWLRLGISRALSAAPPSRGQLAYVARFPAVQLRQLLDSGDPTQLAGEAVGVPQGLAAAGPTAWGAFLAAGEADERGRECGRAVRLLPDVGRACDETGGETSCAFE